MKRLYSIGDSFMSTDDPDDGIIGFCELYCRERGFEHISLARPGATVFATRLQIERAIEQQADFVVVGITCSDRFDLPLNLDERIPLYSLDNIFYKGYRAQSERHVDQTAIKIISDTFNNLLERRYDQDRRITDQQLQAIKAYIAYLHNPSITVQRDYYVISDGLRKLQSAGIDFVLIPGYMGQHDWSWVKRVWPEDQHGPYHMKYGPDNWENPIRYTGTHNPAWAHQEFCQTLLDITPEWING